MAKVHIMWKGGERFYITIDYKRVSAKRFLECYRRNKGTERVRQVDAAIEAFNLDGYDIIALEDYWFFVEDLMR